MSAFTVVKLGNFLEEKGEAGRVLHLEPQGVLFADVSCRFLLQKALDMTLSS